MTKAKCGTAKCPVCRTGYKSGTAFAMSAIWAPAPLILGYLVIYHSSHISDCRQFTDIYISEGSVAVGWLGSRVVSVLDSGAEGPGFKSQPRRCRLTVLGKLFTPIVLLFTKQRNWWQLR